jgi:hypothetical protein
MSRLNKHPKVSKEAQIHMAEFLFPEKKSLREREILKNRLRQLHQLMDSRKITKSNLPTALELANKGTMGRIQVLLNHPKVGPRNFVKFAEAVKSNGYRNVMLALRHKDTNSSNVGLRALGIGMDRYRRGSSLWADEYALDSESLKRIPEWNLKD